MSEEEKKDDKNCPFKMLAKKFRLPADTKFTRDAFSTPLFLLKKIPNNLNISRYGAIASKKVDKRAVVRNRLRRLFINCIQKRQDGVKTGYDILFIIKKRCLEKDRNEICQEILEAFAKINLLK